MVSCSMPFAVPWSSGSFYADGAQLQRLPTRYIGIEETANTHCTFKPESVVYP